MTASSAPDVSPSAEPTAASHTSPSELVNLSVAPQSMRTGGVTATGAAAGAAGAAVASGAGVGWAGAAAGAGAAGAAVEEAGFVEACSWADWQPVIRATASMQAKQPAHFCI